jgi:hypothetical protein
MFAPVAVDNITFPQSSSLSTLDFLPESFEAFAAYSNYSVTSSLYTSQSFTTSLNGIFRWGMGPNNELLGISEGGGVVYKWNANTDTMTSHGTQSPGTVRNVVWDNLTNSWVICGTSSFVKINCDNLAVSSSIAVPSNTGTQYPAVVAFGGKAYAMPLTSVAAATRVAIFDLVANTSTTSSVTLGIATGGGFWGAVLNSVGTIYFFRETAATNNSIYEYNPITDSGSYFGTLSGITGYCPVNLPNGQIAAPVLSNTPGTNIYIINPVNKSIETRTGTNFAVSTGICIGQNGDILGQNTGTNSGIYGYNPTTGVGYKTNVALTNMGGSRSYQDMFSLSDGRLINMPGQSNSGRLDYVTYLPNNTTFPSIGAVNPIMTNGKGI